MAPNPNRLFSQSLLPVVLLCGWLGGGFVPPLAAETGEPVEVQRVRLGPHPEYTRILVDLNRSTDYRLQPDFEHKTLTLILPNARPGPRLRSKTYHDKNLERIGVEARGQAVHIRFQLTQSNTRFFHSMSSDRAQIILDLKGETKPYLGAQIGQPAPPPESRAGDSGDREAVPQRARSRPPASSPPVRILGMTPESVRELNRKAIESKLEHGWEDYQKALTTYQDKNYPKAVELFTRFEEEHGNSKYLPHILYLKAEALFQIAFRKPYPVYEKALEAYKQAVRRFPDSEFAKHARYKIGFIFGEMGLILEAKTLFEEALKKDPQDIYNPARKSSLASFMLQEGKYDQAYRAFQEILQGNPKDLRARAGLFQIADHFYETGDFDRAIRIYEDGAKRWPNELNERPEINFNMGQIYFSRNQYPRARTHFFNFINLDPEHPKAHRALNLIGDAYMIENKFLNALLVFDESVQIQPDSPESQYGLIRMADIGIRDPRLEVRDIIFDVSAYYRPYQTYEAVSKNAKNVDTLAEVTLSRGIAFLKEQNYLKAIEEFKKLLPLGRESRFYEKARKFIRQGLVLLVDQYADQGGVLPVLYSYSDYTSLDLGNITNPKTLLQVGEAYQAIRMYPQALRFYERVKRQDPSKVYRDRVFLNLGRIHLAQKNFQEAELVARSFLKHYPRSDRLPEAMKLMAQSYAGRNQHPKALKVYRDLLRKKQGAASETYFLMGETYAGLDNLKQASRAYQKAIARFDRRSKIVPDYIRKAHYRLGFSFYKTGQYPKAIQALESARSLFPEQPQKSWADFLLMESYEKVKDETRLASQLQDLVQSENSDPLLKQAAQSKLKILDWEKEFKENL